MSNVPQGSPPIRSNNTVLYLLLGLSGVLLAECMCVCCGVGGYFLLSKGPVASFANADLSESNLAKISNGIQTGMTLRQAEAIIGKGSVASPSDISFVNGRLGKFGGAQIQPTPPGRSKYVWKNRGPLETKWLFMDADNSTGRISNMTSYTGPN